jgi:hypothetical protein
VLVKEQDVVMMKKEGGGGAAVVPTCMVKIEGCGIVPAALSPSERAGSCATSIAPVTGQALREHQIHIPHCNHETLIREAGRRQW